MPRSGRRSMVGVRGRARARRARPLRARGADPHPRCRPPPPCLTALYLHPHIPIRMRAPFLLVVLVTFLNTHAQQFDLNWATPAPQGIVRVKFAANGEVLACLLYTSQSPRDRTRYRMPSSA